MRRYAYVATIAIGIVLILGGLTTWILVSNTLGDQRITVSDDSACLAGDDVNGPLSAWCEALTIGEHAKSATGGHTYAELARDDPLRQVAMNAAFLQSSLYTSVVAFGVAGMAMLMGVVFVLLGLGMRDVAQMASHRQTSGEDLM